MDRKLTAILYADVAGYSRLTGADEKGTHAALKDHLAALTGAIEGHGGRIVNTAGDAVLAEFASVVTALECAVAAQRDLAERDREVPEPRKLRFRIGVNLGDVIVDGDEIYGNGVNVAARLETLADAGGICISGRVLEQVKGNIDLGYAYLGAQKVKNIETPVNAYKVLLDPADAGKTISLEKPKAPAWRWTPAAAVAVLILALGGTALWLRPSPSEFERVSVDKMAYPLPDKPSIAVLPFDNLSGDSEQDFIADGLSENIISTLSQIPELFVIARNSTFTYKGKPVKVQQVAEDLGVRYVLEGSLQRSGDRVRITAQLIDAINGHHLWSERHDRDESDILALQDDIAFKIAVALQIKLTEGDQARVAGSTTRSLDAWANFVKSQSEYRKFSKEGKAKARELAEKAVAIDPNYAAAWLMIGWIQLDGARWAESASPEKSLQDAIETANKVAAISPELPSLYNFRGSIFLTQKKYDQAKAAKRRAIELDPNNSLYLASTARALYFMGEYDEAIRLIKEAMRLDPRYPTWYLMFASAAHTFRGDYGTAIEFAKEGLSRPESPSNQAILRILLAFAYVEAGRLDEARSEVVRARQAAPFITVEFLKSREEHRDPAALDRYLGALRKAGLPETKEK